MPIYYHKLWDMLNKKGISQKDLQKNANIAPATFTQMRKGQSVSLDTLERITAVLECDFGDIVTVNPPVFTEYPNHLFSYENTMIAIQNALSDYMEEKNMSVSDISKITTLSINTVKSCLNGNTISSKSLLKLYRLDGFGKMLNIYSAKHEAIVPKKKIYCEKCGKRKSKCWGLQGLGKDSSEQFCGFRFPISDDGNGNLISFNGDCPQPTNYQEFEAAVSKYGLCRKRETFTL